MNIEKEERYLITDKEKVKIIENTITYKERTEMLDLSFYQDGKNLYDLYKYIIRLRKKGDSIKLEIKNYQNENECVESSIKIENIKDVINFLKLMNLEPYIFLKRYRTIRLYKNLKIFIDELDIIGDYVEIEYQDSPNAIEELAEFKKICSINGTKQDMYGAIINEKLKDNNFKEEYQKKLVKILNNL